MSSRALRKIQREREEAALRQQQQEEEEEESDEAPPPQDKPSAFALLNQADGNDDEEDDENQQGSDVDTDDTPAAPTDAPSAQKLTPGSRRKKKKKKANKKAEAQSDKKDVDDIDEILKQLSTSDGHTPRHDSSTDTATQVDYDMLSVNSHHLRVKNEMRKLFGNINFDEEEEEQPQRRRRRDEGISLSEAVKGNQSMSGPGLLEMLRKRNAFIEGRADWPKAPGGGLTMSIENQNSDGSTLYTFMHNKQYQAAQKEFETCVQSMNPELMIQLLRYNPYHIGTLLQVSEIAKQEKDYSTAGELIERALFSFGRALHPRFASVMSQGKARLDFRRPENREFYLASWRYIQNIGMRATWRTAFEWSKLMLQMSPDEDWYAIILCIDQLALRCKQPEALLKICDGVEDIAYLANLQFSKALAQHMLKKPEADATLQEAIKRFPWVAWRLSQTAEISKAPRSIWAVEAPTERTKLHAELYATQASDLWKLKEHAAFLQAAAEQVKKEDCRRAEEVGEDEVEVIMSEARHVLLLEQTLLISLLPTSMTAKLTSSSDPLPPEDNIPTYSTGVSTGYAVAPTQGPPPPEFIRDNADIFIEQLSEANRLFEFLIPGINERIEEADQTGEFSLNEEDMARALNRTEIPPQRFAELFNRLLAFREALKRQPGRRVDGRDGNAAYYDEGGHLRIERGPGAGDE